MPERVAALETRVDGLEATLRDVRVDVKEMKGDVKLLLFANASGTGLLAFFQRIAPWIAIGVAAMAFYYK